MSTVRKSASPARAQRTATARRAESAKKKPARALARPPARPVRPSKPAKPVKPVKAAKNGKPVKNVKPAPKKKAIVVKKKAVAAAPAAKKAASAPTARKGAPQGPPAASKKAPVRLKAVPRPPVPGPEVRPLGVLPPEARARGVDRGAGSGGAGTAVLRPGTPKPTKMARSLGVQRVTEKDLKDLEQRLLAERARMLKEMGHLENTVLKVNPRDSAGDLSGYSFHMADAGTDAYEREKAFQFASTEGRLLMELNEALRRLYRGEYGICESCGNAIAKARLEAMPTARLCRDCKEKEERENRSQP